MPFDASGRALTVEDTAGTTQGYPTLSEAVHAAVTVPAAVTLVAVVWRYSETPETFGTDLDSPSRSGRWRDSRPAYVFTLSRLARRRQSARWACTEPHPRVEWSRRRFR